MKRCLTGLGFLLLIAPCTTAQDKPEYNTALIPDSLKTNAHSVVRKRIVETNIGKPGNALIKTRYAVTVLDDNGTEDVDFVNYEDQFRKLSEAEVRVYDATGNMIKKYKKKEMEKAALSEESTLIQDGKYFYLDVQDFPFPFTVESYTEVSLSGFIDLEDLYTRSPEQSIQQSSLTITAPSSNKIRYKNIGSSIQPVITENKDMVTWQWQVNNSKAMVWERGAPRGSLPRVMISPTFFEMDDYPGEMTNWNTYGQWYSELSKNANKLSAEKFAFFSGMVKDIPDPVEKIRKLYEYLQQNCRYVSIQLGIGGFKPYNATYVDKNKYGDCKALSNFMQTMLSTAGIKSYQALINAGHNMNPVDPEFANHSFNHVILCIPMPKDSIWLECTSRDAAFGQLGSFTENRYALLVTENGGKLVKTPGSKAANNLFGGNNTVMLEADGSGKANVHIRHKGSIHDMFRDAFWEQPESNQKEFLMRSQGFKDYSMNRFVKETLGKDEGITHLELQFEKIPEFSAGSKHFLRPHLYTVWSSLLPEQKTERTTDFMLRNAFVEADTTTWQLPDGYIAENVPASVSFSFELASFETKYINDVAGKKITAITRLEIKSNRIPAAKYNEAQLFFQRVIKELEEKIIVKRG